MQFKKEFDIDKDFFLEKPIRPKKRKVAIKVFLVVMFLTFVALCVSAFSFNFNTRFGKKILAIAPKNLKDAQQLYFDAIRYYDEGNNEKAIEYLNKQLSIVDDPDAYIYLAKIYLEEGNQTLAIANFEKAIEFNPDSYEANYELGKIYFSLNDYKNASKYLTQASKSQIDNLEVLSLTAQAYKLRGMADDAIVLFEKILESEPQNVLANSQIGEIYFQKMEYKKAVSYFEDSLLYSFDENIALKLAKCYFELNKFDSSVNLCNEILEENKDNKAAQSLKRTIEFKMSSQQQSQIEAKKPQEVKQEPINKEVLDSYIKDIEVSIKTNWTPPVGSNLKKASVKFTVNKEGELINNQIYSSSGLVEFDKSALDAIELSKPFPPLPDKLNRETLDIIFTFDFNIQ